MNMPHPIWSLLRLVILMLSLCIILYINAIHFDETELRSIVLLFIVAAGVDVVGYAFSKKQ